MLVPIWERRVGGYNGREWALGETFVFISNRGYGRSCEFKGSIPRSALEASDGRFAEWAPKCGVVGLNLAENVWVVKGMKVEAECEKKIFQFLVLYSFLAISKHWKFNLRLLCKGCIVNGTISIYLTCSRMFRTVPESVDNRHKSWTESNLREFFKSVFYNQHPQRWNC